MVEQKVIVVRFCATSSGTHVEEIPDCIPDGWKVVSLSAMGGESAGAGRGFAAILVIEKQR